MKADAQITREHRRSALISLLNSRVAKQYRQGLLQMAAFCDVIDNYEWVLLFHKVRCGQRKFTEEDFKP